MSIPTYSEAISSDLLQKLHGIGYVGWYVFDSHAPNAFYQVLGHGIVTHMRFRYETTEFLAAHYGSNLQNFIGVTNGDSNCIYMPAYWSTLGETLKNALVQAIGKPRFKEAIGGEQALDKSSQRDCIDEIANLLCISLTWYEMTTQDIITHSFLREGSRRAFLYVCIAEEAGNFYLLFHEKFRDDCVKEGFPFYEKTWSATVRIPQLGDAVRRSESGAEALTKCVEVQQTLIGQLLDIVLATAPQPLDPQLAAQQRAIQSTSQALEEFYRVCNLEPMHAEKLKAFLSLGEAQSEVVSVEASPHTINNCEDFLSPSDYRYQHDDHAFCAAHLSEYWNQHKSKLCPRCWRPLPDTIIKALDPDFYQQESKLRAQQTFANQAFIPRFPTLPSNMQCAFPSTSHSGNVFIMACGKQVCSHCLSAHQMKPGFRGFCPLCSHPLNATETDHVHQAWSLTSKYS